MAERRTLGDLDFEYDLDNPDYEDGWFGRALIADPVSSPDPDDLRLDAASDGMRPADDDPDDTDQWYQPPVAVEPVPTPVARYQQRVVASTESWEPSRFSGGAWDFKASAADPWYRSKRVVITSVAVAVAAIVVTTVLSLSRSPGVEESVSPTHPTTAEPTPATPTPAMSTPGAPPPPAHPAPPPPSTPVEEVTGPEATRTYRPPRQPAPSQSDMPEIGVTRTPVTRAPLSATPPPPRAPDRNSATPGDAPKRGWGRW